VVKTGRSAVKPLISPRRELDFSPGSEEDRCSEKVKNEADDECLYRGGFSLKKTTVKNEFDVKNVYRGHPHYVNKLKRARARVFVCLSVSLLIVFDRCKKRNTLAY
jgi:hypothetical protein